MKHYPRKRFGQHFLHDPGVIEKILAAIAPQPDDHLLEIGPGRGALTRPLLAMQGHLEAIELDRDVIPILLNDCADAGSLHVHQQDALKTDFRQFSQPGPLRLIGNLPYNISTPLLFHLLSQADVIQDMHFMLQREVVDRICAAPNTRAYGRLTVMIARAAHAEKLFTVGPGAFQPPPAVESAVVRLTPYSEPPFPTGDPVCFANIVLQAFNRRRKTLRNALKGVVPPDIIVEAGIDPGMRPETLTPAEFGQLSVLMSRDGRPV